MIVDDGGVGLGCRVGGQGAVYQWREVLCFIAFIWRFLRRRWGWVLNIRREILICCGNLAILQADLIFISIMLFF